MSDQRRFRACVEAWPEAYDGDYDPRCCRFPKSCSPHPYPEQNMAEEDLEPLRPTDTVVAIDPVMPPDPLLAAAQALLAAYDAASPDWWPSAIDDLRAAVEARR